MTNELPPLRRFKLDPSGQHRVSPQCLSQSIDGRRGVTVWKMPDGFSFSFVGFNGEETGIRLSSEAMLIAARLVMQLMERSDDKHLLSYWVAIKPDTETKQEANRNESE